MSTFRGGYSLFIGRIPKNIRVRELEDIFSRHGPLTRCDVKYSGTGSAFAFVDFEDKRDAEDAVRKENGRELNNYKIVVEWAKKPTKPGYGDRERGSGDRGSGGGGRSYGDRGGGGGSYGDRDYRSDRDREPYRGGGGRGGGSGGDRRRDDDDRRDDRRRRRTRSPDDSPDKTSGSKRRRSNSPPRNGKDTDAAVSSSKEKDIRPASKDREGDSNRAASGSPVPASDPVVDTVEEKEEVTGDDKKREGSANGDVAAGGRSRSASPATDGRAGRDGTPQRDGEEEREQSVHEEEEEEVEEKNGAGDHSRSGSRSPST